MSAEEAVGMVDGMEPETVADINDVRRHEGGSSCQHIPGLMYRATAI